MIVKPIRVEVFSSPGCSRCARVFAMLDSVTQDFRPDVIE